MLKRTSISIIGGRLEVKKTKERALITRTSTVSTEVCSSELAVALAALAVAVAVAETARSFFRLGLHCTMVTSALLNKRTVSIQKSSKRYIKQGAG